MLATRASQRFNSFGLTAGNGSDDRLAAPFKIEQANEATVQSGFRPQRSLPLRNALEAKQQSLLACRAQGLRHRVPNTLSARGEKRRETVQSAGYALEMWIA